VAGRISTDLARRQGAANLGCKDCGDFVAVDSVSVGDIKNPRGTQRLMEYWTHGPGAIKIGWGVDGSFRRCVALLRKYFPKNPEGLCANLHHRATGEWPTEHGKAGIPS
jgi:hypothetical protein